MPMSDLTFEEITSGIGQSQIHFLWILLMINEFNHFGHFYWLFSPYVDTGRSGLKVSGGGL